MANQELQCPFCEKTSSRGTGLASHIRGSHPKQYPGWKKNKGNTPRTQATSSPAKGAETTTKGAEMPTKSAEMPGGLKGIIANLEHQKNAIELALTALRAVEGLGFEDAAETAPAAATGRVTAEGRERLSAAMKKRWAAKRAAPAAKRGRPKKKSA
jgi:hypothetical protein